MGGTVKPPIDDELHQLLAAHALDALEPAEAAALELRIEHDDQARAELDEFRRAGAWLASSGGPAPPGVWDRIADDLFPTIVEEPVSIHEARAKRQPRWLAVAAAAAAALVAVGLGVIIGSSGGSPSGTRLEALASAAETAPGARPSSLRDSDGRELAHAVVLRDGTGYLTSDLPALSAGRTYQLWALVDTRMISLGVLGRDPGIVAFTAAADPSGLAVTAEPAGGVATTNRRPVALGKLEAA